MVINICEMCTAPSWKQGDNIPGRAFKSLEASIDRLTRLGYPEVPEDCRPSFAMQTFWNTKHEMLQQLNECKVSHKKVEFTWSYCNIYSGDHTATYIIFKAELRWLQTYDPQNILCLVISVIINQLKPPVLLIPSLRWVCDFYFLAYLLKV